MKPRRERRGGADGGPFQIIILLYNLFGFARCRSRRTDLGVVKEGQEKIQIEYGPVEKCGYSNSAVYGNAKLPVIFFENASVVQGKLGAAAEDLKHGAEVEHFEASLGLIDSHFFGFLNGLAVAGIDCQFLSPLGVEL